MRFHLFAATAIILSAGSTVRASTFNLNFSGSGELGAVVLTANPTATAGAYLITAASGIVDGSSAALLAPGAYPTPFPNDNLLFLSGTADEASFDVNGVSFVLGTGLDLNLYNQAGQYFTTSGPMREVADLTSVSVTPGTTVTPEPASFVLLGTGLLGALSVARRRFAERA